jgi:hypothetical protein
MLRAVFAGVLLALSASDGSAQITTYVAPPRPVTPSRAAAAADSVRRDSVDKATMTNMKAWVDSAAGVAVPAHVGDSTTTPPAPAPAPAPPVVREEPVATTFENGSVAPATASNLPAISLLGVLGIAFGAVLLARRHRG